MKIGDRNNLITYYSKLLYQYGPNDAKSLSWIGKSTQEARFEIFLKVGDFTKKSILDVGCGVGDFYGFLSPRFKNIKYLGIDINPKTIQLAKQKYPAAKFLAEDFSRYKGNLVDYAVSSGSFTFKIHNYKDVYFKQIRKMFDHSKIAVGFNMLNVDKYTGSDNLVSYQIEEVVSYCRKFTKNVKVEQDYLENDFTILLRH